MKPKTFEELDAKAAPRGRTNNCALANGDAESNCQVCSNRCPDVEWLRAHDILDERLLSPDDERGISASCVVVILEQCDDERKAIDAKAEDAKRRCNHRFDNGSSSIMPCRPLLPPPTPYNAQCVVCDKKLLEEL